jgi:transcriptional regulator with XRE-family HTH domain
MTTRLRILINALNVTQATLAKRAGLSLAAIKQRLYDSRPMTQHVALAIAIATGVDFHWLMGDGRRFPIRARFGQVWKPEMAEAIQERKLDRRAAEQDAHHCLVWFLINSDRMARIILAGFKRKSPMLALARLHVCMDTLSKEFKVNPEPVKYMGKTPYRAAAETTRRLIQGLNAETERRI